MCFGKQCNCCNTPMSGGCNNCETSCDQTCFKKEFNAKEFLNNLLTKGSYVACDESSEAFNNQELPRYYDEEMFKRGQAYFHKHIFGMFLGNLLGLLCGLAIKSSLAILILTHMSSSELTAYKRYVATIFHMLIWYDSEFRPGSRLWESIKDVKSKHNSASKKALSNLKYRINQKDMALTQFGFMGLAVTRSKMLGIHEEDEEELKCFIHVWRVIGYVLGIEDEFNLCRESVEETKKICEEITVSVLRPAVEAKDSEHTQMCSYLINGLWAINPFLDHNTFSFYLQAVLNNDVSIVSSENDEYRHLSFGEKLRLRIIVFVIGLMRFNVIRILLKRLQNHSLWLAQTSPYLAYYKFGKKNSHVNVIGAH